MTGAGPNPAMQTANLETLVPGLAEQRAAERHNRALAFSGLTHTLCGVEILAFTPMHRLRLQLIRNGFVIDTEPSRYDVFAFLWMLSPHWRAEGHGVGLTYRRWVLKRLVMKLDLEAAVPAIWAYIASQIQDAPGSSVTTTGTDHSPYIYWMAEEAGFWIDVHGGFTLESYQATPYLVLQQLYRVWQVHHPVVSRNARGEVEVDEPLFLNASDSLVGNFHRQHRAAIAEAIQAQRERSDS